MSIIREVPGQKNPFWTAGPGWRSFACCLKGSAGKMSIVMEIDEVLFDTFYTKIDAFCAKSA